MRSSHSAGSASSARRAAARGRPRRGSALRRPRARRPRRRSACRRGTGAASAPGPSTRSRIDGERGALRAAAIERGAQPVEVRDERHAGGVHDVLRVTLDERHRRTACDRAAHGARGPPTSVTSPPSRARSHRAGRSSRPVGMPRAGVELDVGRRQQLRDEAAEMRAQPRDGGELHRVRDLVDHDPGEQVLERCVEAPRDLAQVRRRRAGARGGALELSGRERHLVLAQDAARRGSRRARRSPWPQHLPATVRSGRRAAARAAPRPVR